MVNINEIGEGVTPYKFSIGEETKYGMDYNFHTEDGDAYLVQFDEGNFSDVYDLAFYAVGSSGFMSDEEMNKGRQFKIISTILAIIKDFIKETPGVQGIEFSGKKKEGKETNQRDLLYNAYVKKHIREFPGWDFKIGNNETKLFKKETLKESKPLTGLSQFLVESFLQEVNEKYNEVIGLFPGGYKPPTIAYFHIVDEISKRPEITKLKVLIGPKERDNITSEQSLQIWNIYKKYLNNKVEFEKSSISPVKDVLDIIKNNPQNYYILVVGRDEDYNRFKSADKYNNIKIVSIKEAGEGISGTKARQEILSDNYINFQKYIPTELTLKERGEIWNILTKNKKPLNEAIDYKNRLKAMAARKDPDKITEFGKEQLQELESNEIKYWANYFNIFNKLKDNPDKIYNFLKTKLKGEQLEALLYFYDFIKQEDKKILNEEIMTRGDFKKHSNDIKIKEYIDKALEYCCNKSNISKPKLIIVYEEYTKENNSFGGYSPSDKKVYLRIEGRNLSDALRTLFHEVGGHHKQNEENRLPEGAGKDGDEYENEANSIAGIMVREFGRENPEIYTITC